MRDHLLGFPPVLRAIRYALHHNPEQFEGTATVYTPSRRSAEEQEADRQLDAKVSQLMTRNLELRAWLEGAEG